MRKMRFRTLPQVAPKFSGAEARHTPAARLQNLQAATVWCFCVSDRVLGKAWSAAHGGPGGLLQASGPGRGRHCRGVWGLSNQEGKRVWRCSGGRGAAVAGEADLVARESCV